VKIKQVSEDLGVQYVLEGSIERSGDRIRIATRFVDALNGRTIWAERYDREIADVFALQDEMTVSIISALRLKGFGQGELSATVQKHHKGKEGLECYLKELEAEEHYTQWSLEGTAIALSLGKEAVAECPEDPDAHTVLGSAYARAAFLGGPVPRSEAIEKGIGCAQKALEIDNSLCDAHSLLSGFFTLKGEHEKSLSEAEIAVSLNPGSTDALTQYAYALGFVGRYTESIPIFEKIIRRNPYSRPAVFRGYGRALIGADRFEEAVVPLKKAAQLAPEDIYSHLQLVRCYDKMGKDTEAKSEVSEVLRINPKFSLETFAKVVPSGRGREAAWEAWLNALRRAGLPDKSPSAQAQKDSSQN
jgi:adenylate cyclase